MRNIEAHSFHGLPSLAVLNLEQNQLSNIPRDPRGHYRSALAIPAALSGVFWNLPALRALHLADNQLDNVDATFFASLPSLRVLNMSRNSLTRIDSRAWTHMPALEVLDLSSNSLDLLSDRLCLHLVQLERLNASTNQLSRIESGTFHCQRLRSLDLSHNILSGFSDDAFHPRNALQYLDLSHNLLGNVPDLRHLGFLRTVFLIFLTQLLVDLSHLSLCLNLAELVGQLAGPSPRHRLSRKPSSGTHRSFAQSAAKASAEFIQPGTPPPHR